MIVYIQAIIALFAIVDPVGNIPIFMDMASELTPAQSRKAYNTAVFSATMILLSVALVGRLVLRYVFRIEFADLELAGGLLLVIISVKHLMAGRGSTLPKPVSDFNAHEIGCVPLGCPLLAGPGAMVTVLASLERSGWSVAILSILVVMGLTWVATMFVDSIQKYIGRLVTMVFSKVLSLFIAAIGVNMVMNGLMFYFKNT